MIVKALQKLKSFGFQPKKILDIGANKGKWTLEIKKKVFPDSDFTLIEAIEYKELEKLSIKYHNINFKNILLDEKEHEVTWYEKRNTGDSLFRENTGYFDDCKELVKNTSTLDLAFNDSNFFELIKIDCQGAEIPILKGGKNLVQNATVIILEVPFMGEYNIGAPNFYEHIQYMENIGYRVFDIVELHRVDNILIQIDIIFIKKGHYFEKKVDLIIKKQGR
ncbi:MAG: FkbM family methyltransferase [Alphaproteobacteria bacterium]|nr:FkbM family methyltransferase [Alphaproteobacteria bacterium]